MLVNTKEMLNKAKKEKRVVFQFNINNLEWTRYILEKTNELEVPVILGVSEGAIKYMGGYHVVTDLVKALIFDLGIKNDVSLHLDHGSSVDSCKKAIEAGFTSVMIDMSKLPLNENIANTKLVCDMAHSKNVTVEAEIGHVGGIEDNVVGDISLTNYNECLRFVKETGLDSLAPAIGTVHGIYKGKLNIAYDLIQQLSEGLEVPLVMHGGSGLSDECLIKAVRCGINKININSDLQYAWHQSVKKFVMDNPDVYDPRKIIASGRDAIYEVITEKINIISK